MIYQTIRQCIQSVRQVEQFLDLAEQYAAYKQFDVEVLVQARLAPDMQPLLYQIQSACDYLKAGAARLAGLEPPKHADTEATLSELRERIVKTLAYAESITPSQYDAANMRKVRFYGANANLTGENYLLQVVVPNLYFHIAMTYAILRHNGVDLGKRHFLGPLTKLDN